MTKIKTIGKEHFQAEKIYRGSDAFYGSDFVIPTKSGSLSFSVLGLIKTNFANFKKEVSEDVFQQVMQEGPFQFAPKFRGLWDNYIGKTGEPLRYIIKDHYLIVASSGEQNLGYYWLFIEGLWKISE